MAGQGDALPIKCGHAGLRPRSGPQTGFTGDLETGPLVKASRPGLRNLMSRKQEHEGGEGV